MLKLYDRDHNFIGRILKYSDCKKESEVATGDATLSFTYLAGTFDIQNEYYVRTRDAEYVVKEVSGSRTEGQGIVAVLNLDDLEQNAFQEFSVTDTTIDAAARLLLAGTGWTVGECTVTKRRNAGMRQVDARQGILKLCTAFMCEPVFDTKAKTVSFYEEAGEDKGVYFLQGLNLQKLSKTRNSYDYYTRIIPIGADGLTIEGVNGGKNYLENYQYSNKVRPYIWVDESYTDAQALKDDAEWKLDDMSKPVVEYSAKVIDLAKQNPAYGVLSYHLGDKVMLIDQDTGTREKQRIVKMTEYEQEPEKNTCELANTVLTFEEMQDRLQAAADIVGYTITDDGKIRVSDILKWEEGVAGSQAVQGLNSSVSTLSGQYGALSLLVGTINANYLSADQADLKYANIERLEAAEATVHSIQGDYATFKTTVTDELSAQTAIIDDLKASQITVEYLDAHYLNADTADLKYATVENLNATNATVSQISGDFASFRAGEFAELSAAQADFESATAKNFEAQTATITELKAAMITTDYLKANFAQVDLANIKDGCITTAMIGQGVVGTVQIADSSITDAKIVELTANKITAGTLSVERLEIRGSENSIVYALNNITGALQAENVDTLNGEILTPRTITADRIVANSITGNEIAARSIMANNLVANSITADELAAGSVTTTILAAGAVTADNIAAGAVTADKLAAGSIIVGKLDESLQGMINGAAAKVEVQYATSTSPTVPPTSGWSTTAPPWESGKYMWQKTVTTHSDGSIGETTVTCLSGAIGQTGATGAPGKDGEPGKDGAPGKDGTQGINLLLSTQELTSPWSIVGGTKEKDTDDFYYAKLINTWSTYIYQYLEIAAGTYTFSFYAKLASDTNQTLEIKDDGANNRVIAGNITINSTSWKQYVVKCTIPQLANKAKIAFLTRQNTVAIYIKKIKLELGSVDTPVWTPAQQDLVGPQGPQGVKGADGKGVSSTAVTYQAASSGTAVPTGNWEANPPSTSAGQYLWTKTVITYTDKSTTTMYSVSRNGSNGTNGTNGTNGKDGAAGKGISSITNYYLATSAGSGVTTGTTGWSTNPATQTLTATNKYLWNYEVTKYTDNTSSTIEPHIIGVYGDKGATGGTGAAGAAGKGIKSIAEYYTVSSSTTAPADTAFKTGTTPPTMTATDKYLWNYELITYTDNSTYKSDKRIIGAFGNTGATGPTGAKGKGIKTYFPQYYLSTSNTTQTGGSWSDKDPGWVSGKYIWTRTHVVYDDGSTEDTTPVLANALNSANSTAASANSTANSAKSTADSANSTANSAKSTADAAKSAADAAKKNVYHTANASGGTAGYFLFAQIKIGGNYQNQPIKFGGVNRNGVPSTVWVTFANANNNDPGLSRFSKSGTANFYIVKSTTSTWNLYVQKAESYDSFDVTEYEKGNYMSSTTVTWKNECVTSLPAGYTTATQTIATAEWCYNNDITYINGGKIYAATVTATQLAANAVTTEKLNANAVTTAKLATDAIKSKNYAYSSGNYSTAGTFLDLSNGVVRSKNFAIDANGNAYYNGTLDAAKITTGTLSADRIGAKSIKAAKIDIDDLFAQSITAKGTITGAKLVGGSVTVNGTQGKTSIGASGLINQTWTTVTGEEGQINIAFSAINCIVGNRIQTSMRGDYIDLSAKDDDSGISYMVRCSMSELDDNLKSRVNSMRSGIAGIDCALSVYQKACLGLIGPIYCENENKLITPAEVSYLFGATSNIQTQINSLNTSRTDFVIEQFVSGSTTVAAGAAANVTITGVSKAGYKPIFAVPAWSTMSNVLAQGISHSFATNTITVIVKNISGAAATFQYYVNVLFVKI